MGISLGKSKPGSAARGRPAFVKISYKEILYLGPVVVALLVCMAAMEAVAAAQEELPQISMGERKIPSKKDTGPRAVGVLQMMANGKSSLVPIAIMINGKFWDASAYKADPVPMALEPGTVYEAERTGNSLGLFTVNTALHSNAVNAPNPWIATGAWVPEGTETAKPQLKAEAAPVGIDNSDAPPRLTRNPSKETAGSAPAGGGSSAPASNAPSSGAPKLNAPTSSSSPPSPTQPNSSQPSSTQTSGTSSSGSSDEPPRLTKSASTTPAPAGGSTQTNPSSSGQNGGNQAPANSGPSNQSKSASAKTSEQENVPVSDSGADEANRPRLRHGKPAEPFGDDDVPGYSKPGAAPMLAAKAVKSSEAASNTPVQMVPAISDAGGPSPHSYGFEWLKDEEGDRRKQMIDAAKQRLRAYLSAAAKRTITPTASKASVRRAAAVKPPEPILENVQMHAYDLWTNNQPVIVLSAEAHLPPTGSSAAGAGGSDLRYSILIVAYPDIYNNLHMLYAGVTDKYHLDVTPRLELVDAVDADGDGRGELLFRETSDAGQGWVIYRATVDTLWKMFDSLNAE